jgi:L,D-transpeptidase catalytic domain
LKDPARKLLGSLGRHERVMANGNAGSIRAMILAAFAVCIVAAEPAHAQFLFWPQSQSWWSKHAPFRHKHHHRHKKPRLAKKAPAPDAPKGPLQIIVSIADQRISVYDDGALIARSSVSTGVPRHPTPSGVFSVIGKKRWHRSNLYSNAPMPYMQRITWSGIALHEGVVPGYPASHGCIRLKKDFAVRLWHLTRRGTRVVIAADDIRPVEIANPRLFAAKPKAVSAPLESRVADAQNTIMAAAAVHPPSTPDAGAQQVADVAAPDAARAAVAARKPVPISVFVSRKLSRIFVRQAFTPLFDSPITIQDPQEPLGTHVFTAMRVEDEGVGPRWTVISMPEKFPRTADASSGRKPGNQLVETTPAPSSPDKANVALDRIEIPPDVIERIAERLTPGSSLIVSDFGISRETGHDTDFIVVMP